jgi:hypothetical protein
VTREHLNGLIQLFGENLKHEMRAERRETMQSVLFDLPRRSLLGWFALYEHEAAFIRELLERVSPEDVGRRMKVPGTRPYHLQLFIVACSYLLARHQRMLELGVASGEPFPEEREDDLACVLDFWERASRAYRNDGQVLPVEAGGTLPVLGDEHLRVVGELLRPARGEAYTEIRRTAATLELFSFVLHGEQRDGVFGHGPYPGDDGRTIFVKEFNDLRNDYLPWAATETRIPLANVIVAQECHDTAVRCDMFGGLVTDPIEIDDRLDRVVVLTQAGGALRTLEAEEIEAVREAAATAQIELYMRAIEWTQRYKIEYGARLFANHLKPFFDVSGMDGDTARRIALACDETASRMVDDLLATAERGEIAAVWGDIGTTPGPLLRPVA